MTHTVFLRFRGGPLAGTRMQAPPYWTPGLPYCVPIRPESTAIKQEIMPTVSLVEKFTYMNEKVEKWGYDPKSLIEIEVIMVPQ